MKLELLCLVGIFVLLAFGLEAAIKTEPVEYKAGGVTMKGMIAYDDAKQGKRPGVIVVHEWWGNNEYSQKRARMLAELGYTALAADMFGEGKQATHPNDASKFVEEVSNNMAAAQARFVAAMNTLKAHKTVDPQHIAAIGYCFGGGLVIEMARRGLDLDGVVSFHGNPATKGAPATPGQVKAKILVAHGAADPFVEPEQVTKFEEEMKNAKADARVIQYPNAQHSFTNPAADENGKKFNLPLAYNAEADTKSWEDMQKFLKEVFGQ
jgi:dienelactone hydrolase